MPKNKDSIAVPIPLADAIAAEATAKRKFLYQVVADAWECYRQAQGIPKPPDPYEALFIKAHRRFGFAIGQRVDRGRRRDNQGGKDKVFHRSAFLSVGVSQSSNPFSHLNQQVRIFVLTGYEKSYTLGCEKHVSRPRALDFAGPAGWCPSTPPQPAAA